MPTTADHPLALIGTCFMDIKGYAGAHYDPIGRNPGSIEYYNGGVAGNVALNCAGIGTRISFISMTDIGPQGDAMMAKLQSRGVNTALVQRTESGGTGIWLAILDENGELAGSISQQPDFSLLEKHLRTFPENFLKDYRALLLEIDLTEALAEQAFSAAEKADIPVYVIVGNLTVVLARPDFLSRAACFICNEIEAGKIFGCSLINKTPEEVLSVLKVQAELFQISSMVITMGDAGAVYYDRKTGECGLQKAVPVEVADTTGAGDAFFSACACALSRGLSLQQACRFGALLSSRVISSRENIAPVLPDFFP